MAQQFAVWRVIEPKLSAGRGTGHHNVMRDLLFCKRVMRDLQDLLLEFRDKWTPSDLVAWIVCRCKGLKASVMAQWLHDFGVNR